MIPLSEHANGTLLPIKAQTGAKRSGIVGEHGGGALKVCVNAVREKGQANEAICDVLAEQLKLRRNQLELVRGATATSKLILVRDVTAADLAARIDRAIARAQK